MANTILLTSIFKNEEFDSQPRRQGREDLAQIGQVVDYNQTEFTAEHARGVVGIIADSALFTRSFYEAADDLRIIARWGVGFDKVNVDIATEIGVIITVSPVHMVTVAEYAIAQWMATLKRVYTLNQLSHGGRFDIIRTYESLGSTFGIYGLGRIGQEVAKRARPLLGDEGRLLVYDTRPDIGELAAQFGAEAVDDPLELFRQCDAVSLHVSGDEPIVSARELDVMQPHASLINPSRGLLVDDEAVNRAIKADKLYYYVVDDPVDGPRAIHKDHPRIICTNHNAGITVESTIRLDQCCYNQVADALQGKTPPHVLNPEVLQHPRVRAFLDD
ncbi:MAG: hypothetical protein GKR89_34640 [Candidatus Latescibacteria bacterium]|nr:hypothetical protein [Candidatus Latescibacterota bacterium]